MTQSRRLTIVLVLNLTMIIGLVIVGFSARSLGVLAAAGDYAADSAALGLGLLAVAIRARKGDRSKAPTYVAAVNAAALMTVSASVLVAGLYRLIHGTPEVQGLPVLIVSSIATLLMTVGACVLGTGSGREDLHMRSVLLDTVADAVTSAAVAVGGLIIYATGSYRWVDSALSVLISLVVGAAAARLLWRVGTALRAGSPIALDDD